MLGECERLAGGALGFDRVSKLRSVESSGLLGSLNAAVIRDGRCGLGAMCDTPL